MAQIYNIGDVVSLKSGGPDMTIEGYVRHVSLSGPVTYSQTKVTCVWFTGDKQSRDTFHQDSLEKSED
jgi:uncharacterized protein YodC (DUF2158 family)